MRFVHKRVFFIFRFIMVLSLTLIPVYVFTRLVHAEGPLLPFLILTALCVTGIFFALNLKNADKKESPVQWKISRLFFILSLILGCAAITVVLVQVNVSRRSLAEAWLELAREGKAFGFFSFFAAEIYAFFYLGLGILLSLKRYRSYAIAGFTVNCLCAGIILNNAVLLSLCICGAFFFMLLPENSRKEIRSRIVSLSFPLLGGFLLCIGISFYYKNNPSTPNIFPSPNLSGFFIRFAPAFPLIRDVPGYGTTIGAAEMPSSAVLSTRPLFRVQGEGNSVHYLASGRFSVWNGAQWEKDTSAAEPIPFSLPGRETGETINSPSVLNLELLEDFYPGVPVEWHTEALRFITDTPVKITVSRKEGALFEPSARRGLKVALLSSAQLTSTAEEPILDSYGGTNNSVSEQVKDLALKLKTESNAAQDDRQYIRNILKFLSTGFDYSLQTGTKPKNVNPIDYFLFTDKKGFCLYYASAFVLLAREGGLKARMVEGFRVRLDEEGIGVISGQNAHAWPEVWLDGDWRTFEPTPPFTQENPFSYVREGDSGTRRQLEILFGKITELKEKSHVRLSQGSFIAILVSPVIAFCAALAVMLFQSSPTKKTRRLARRMIRRYRKKGILGPERVGWLAWAEKVVLYNPKENASGIAQAMILQAFSNQQKNKL